MEWIKICYYDASALVKLLVKEEGSDIILKYQDEHYFHIFIRLLCVLQKH